MTIGEWLVLAKKKVGALDAELIAADSFGVSRAELLAHQEWIASDENLDFTLSRRVSGEPMAYIRGRQEFYGREFLVTPEVLIPRPETEILVEAVLGEVSSGSVLDLGTGSGAIAITFALENPALRVTASDVSEAALKVASANARRLGAEVHFVKSDTFGAFGGRFDAVVSNPPYVTPGDPNLEPAVARWEPALALYSPGGLGFIESLVRGARKRIKPGGLLAFEMGFGQAPAIESLLKDWDQVRMVPDLAGIPRVALARRSYEN